jgi:8-oxo-dGTP diphosphatase
MVEPPPPSCFFNTSLLPLSEKRPMLLVTAAVLIDNENRFLLAQRPKDKPMPGLWEFPGGKIHKNELPEEALVRELGEELGIEVAPGCLFPLTFASHPYPDFHLLMPIYACRVWRGEVTPREGQNIAWATKKDCRKYPMPEADKKVLPSLLELI